ncbi:hypothetical protein [Kibdelosporangium philippinense]|uniref:hypothetical protein n=1 Tax=Kibdelosporangium philippinense TaxID=211113 RepID=UPI003622A97A
MGQLDYPKVSRQQETVDGPPRPGANRSMIDGPIRPRSRTPSASMTAPHIYRRVAGSTWG